MCIFWYVYDNDKLIIASITCLQYTQGKQKIVQTKTRANELHKSIYKCGFQSIKTKTKQIKTCLVMQPDVLVCNQTCWYATRCVKWWDVSLKCKTCAWVSGYTLKRMIDYSTSCRVSFERLGHYSWSIFTTVALYVISWWRHQMETFSA